MKEINNFAVVRKQPSAVEKATPGAKRILSGMVVDILTLVKTKFSVAFCGPSPDTKIWNEFVKNQLKELLPDIFEIELNNYLYSWELFEAATNNQVDMFIIFLNPQLLEGMGAHGLVKILTRRFVAKPILILTNQMMYGLDSAEEFKQSGAVALISFRPSISFSELKEALKTCVEKTGRI